MAGKWKFFRSGSHLRMTISFQSLRKPPQHICRIFVGNFGSFSYCDTICGASAREFRVLLRKWHPDKNPDQQEVRFGEFFFSTKNPGSKVGKVFGPEVFPFFVPGQFETSHTHIMWVVKVCPTRLPNPLIESMAFRSFHGVSDRNLQRLCLFPILCFVVYIYNTYIYIYMYIN